MKTVSFHIFNRFVYDEDLDITLPTFVLGSITSSIRLIARYQSNPIVLSRFMENQKQTRLRTSAFIEICRFLVIFPSYRFTMLEMIKNFTTKSIYNDFTLFMFDYLLTQHNSTTLSDFYTKCFDFCYTGFITHSYFYWKARKKKKYCRSFFEAFTCSYYVTETEKILNGLFYLHPFVLNLHKYLADVLLNIHGDFEGYKKEMKFCLSFEKKTMMVFDPILQANAKINPKILQYCNQDTHILNNMSAASSAMNTVSISTNFSLFQKKHKSEKVREKKTVASKIVKSEKNIPYLHFFHYIFPPLIIIVFIILSDQLRKEYQSNTKSFANSIDLFERYFYDISSSIFIPFALKNQPEINLNDIVECQKNFALIPSLISQYYIHSPIMSNQTNLNLIIAFHEICNLIKNSGNICDVVENIPDSMHQITANCINLMHQESVNCYKRMRSDIEITSKLHNMKLFLLYGSIALVIFLFIYFIVNCISLNTIMGKNKKAIDFLASKKRVSPVLQDPQTRENLWDQMIGFDSSFILSESSLDSEFYPDNDIITTSASFLSTTLFSVPNSLSATHQSSSNPKFAKSNESALIPAALLESADSTESGQLSREHSFGILPSTFTGSEPNFLDNSKLIDPASIKDNLESTNLDSIMIDNTNDNNDNDNANDKHRSSSVPAIASQENIKTNTPKEVDLDELKVYLKGRSKLNCHLNVLIILIILFPWILLYLIAIVGYYPLIVRKNAEYEQAEMWLSFGEDFYSSVLLLNQTLSFHMTRTIDHSHLDAVNSTFSKRIGKHYEMYFNEQCFEFDEIQCISIYNVTKELYDGNCSSDFIEFFALPIVVTFTEKMLKDFTEVIELNHYGNSPRAPFLMLSILFLIISAIVGFKKTVSLKKSLNSLFHFPSFENQNDQSHDQTADDTLNSKENMSSKEKVTSKDSQSSNASINVEIKIDLSSTKSEALISSPPRRNSEQNNNDDLDRFPTNIIIVTSVAETDEIYSISDTCQKIINRKPSDLICRKFSKNFPIKKIDQNFDIREYNGKTFISKSIVTGKIAKTVLIEALKSEAKTKSTNIIQKLINFMPNYFAKQFSEEFINFFNFYRSILIFIRINPNAGQIENFFSLLSRLDQTFFNIDFIRSNGSVLACVCSVQDELEILLFLRDLIISCQESCKKKMDNFALKSIYVDLINELNAEIEEGDIEPEIIFEDNEFFEIEQITYYVDDNFVALSDELIKTLNSISKLSNQTNNINGKLIHTIPFKLFSDEFLNNL